MSSDTGRQIKKMSEVFAKGIIPLKTTSKVVKISPSYNQKVGQQ